MPVEKSQKEVDFEYGEDFGDHIERYDQDFSKVLVRYDPDGDTGMNERQTERLRRLSEWLHANDRRLLFELLVPAEENQLASVDGDACVVLGRDADNDEVDDWLRSGAPVDGYVDFPIGRLIWGEPLKSWDRRRPLPRGCRFTDRRQLSPLHRGLHGGQSRFCLASRGGLLSEQHGTR